MSAVKDTIIWLDAFTSSIDEELPSAKQWKKILAKVAELSKMAKAGKADDIAEQPAAERDPSEPVARPPKLVDFTPKSQKSATVLYIQALMDGGCDEDTANDFARDYKWNKDIPPAEQAKEDLARFGAAA